MYTAHACSESTANYTETEKNLRSGKNRSRAALLTMCTANSPASIMSQPSLTSRLRFCASGSGGVAVSSCKKAHHVSNTQGSSSSGGATHRLAHDARDALDRAAALGAVLDLRDADPAPRPRHIVADALARVRAPALPPPARGRVGQRGPRLGRHGRAHEREAGLEVRAREELGVQRCEGVRGREGRGECGRGRGGGGEVRRGLVCAGG